MRRWLIGWVLIFQSAVGAFGESNLWNVTGGDYERGRSLFFGERLKCGSCHRIRDRGGAAGPDLGNLIQRERDAVLRNIVGPNALPDHAAFTASMDENGLCDLLTFLLYAPPKRPQSEAQSFLQRNRVAGTNRSTRAITIVLVASKQDHGPGQHDYPAWQRQWNQLLSRVPNVTVTNAWEWPTAEQFRTAHVLIFYYWNHKWDAGQYHEVDAFLARGGGMALFHSACISDKEPEKLAERIGLAASPAVKYVHTPLTLKFVAKEHPITRGFKELELLDEPYWPMIGNTNNVEVLAVCDVEGTPRPLIWTHTQVGGRVFVSIPGHYTWTLDDPLFRILALRAIAWTAKEDMNRFEALTYSSDSK